MGRALIFDNDPTLYATLSTPWLLPYFTSTLIEMMVRGRKSTRVAVAVLSVVCCIIYILVARLTLHFALVCHIHITYIYIYYSIESRQ